MPQPRHVLAHGGAGDRNVDAEPDLRVLGAQLRDHLEAPFTRRISRSTMTASTWGVAQREVAGFEHHLADRAAKNGAIRG